MRMSLDGYPDDTNASPPANNHVVLRYSTNVRHP